VIWFQTKAQKKMRGTKGAGESSVSLQVRKVDN
jgi:hypothetical protein